MSKPSSSGQRSRASSDYFLVGPASSDLGKDARQAKLPLTRDVMKYFFHRKNLPEFRSKPADKVICCPFKAGTTTANCDTNPSCNESSECIIKKVKNDGNWIKAGIPIIHDLAINP